MYASVDTSTDLCISDLEKLVHVVIVVVVVILVFVFIFYSSNAERNI